VTKAQLRTAKKKTGARLALGLAHSRTRKANAMAKVINAGRFITRDEIDALPKTSIAIGIWGEDGECGIWIHGPSGMKYVETNSLEDAKRLCVELAAKMRIWKEAMKS
jgi:hypothetical protein